MVVVILERPQRARMDLMFGHAYCVTSNAHDTPLPADGQTLDICHGTAMTSIYKTL